MYDIKWIIQNPDEFDAGLKKRGVEAMSATLAALDEKRREHVGKVQAAQQRRNAASKEIGAAMGKGEADLAEKLKAEVGELKVFLSEAEQAERQLDSEIQDALSTIPNIPLDDVPVGKDESDNAFYREWGEKPNLGFDAKEHYELGETMGQMDFDTAAKISGSRFVLLSKEIARMERALGQMMLDLHTEEHGYDEVSPPLLVNDETMYGTGQLPKFAEDLFESQRSKALSDQSPEFQVDFERLTKLQEEWEVYKENYSDGKYLPWPDYIAKANGEFLNKHRNSSRLWLIPTAEVPLTNIVRGETIDHAYLPRRYTALTYCFRSEAGSAGRDTRGMLRQHQFLKCELVSIVDKDSGETELERMLGCAEKVLQNLGLHYRVMTLCTGDMGFGARKTYDIEVWVPGQNTYREISSCSVCGDFQGRRMNARYREEDGKKLTHVHTLNGSGIAVGRALIAVMENYQNEDGSIDVPKALQPYMGGKTKVGVPA